jgi:RNA 3'-terminal phosphate cyclase (ATP)
MITIDGSHGEGGGQILRLSVALSAVTREPIRVINIRHNRPSPGLKPQHVMAINSVAEICHAQVEGNTVGSSTITFYPDNIKGGSYSFDIGTAGSTTLVLQACILPSLFADKKVDISITGGTDVKWAPPWDYFHHVFLSHLQNMNVNIQGHLIRRGYYPRGGGKVTVAIDPVDTFSPLTPRDPQSIKVKGLVNMANLPSHIGDRIKKSAAETLAAQQIPSDIDIILEQSSSVGVGLVLWTYDGSILGADCLGEKGISSEKVGSLAASLLLSEIQSGATLDVYAVDQMLPYLALSRKGFFFCREISRHAYTEMWLLKMFLKKDFLVQQSGVTKKVTVVDSHDESRSPGYAPL